MSLITVAEYKQYKNIENNDNDALILPIINAAEAWLNSKCNRTLVATSDSTRYFDSYSECVDGDTLIFDHVIASITTITIDGTELTSSEYVTNPRNTSPYYEVIIKRSVSKTWQDDNAVGDYVAEDAIAVIGKWGYYSSADEYLKQMMKRLVDFAFTQKDAGAFETIAIPSAGVIETPSGFPRDVVDFVLKHRSLE